MLVEVGANDGHVRDSLVGRDLPSAQEPDSQAGSVIIMQISCQRFEGIGGKIENGVFAVVFAVFSQQSGPTTSPQLR